MSRVGRRRFVGAMMALPGLADFTNRTTARPAQSPGASKPSASRLEGTSWQLVRFKGGDGRILSPADRTRYTLEFAGNGTLTLRIDCNRGRGTWKSTGTGGLELGPLALTRASCPGDLNDRLAHHWPDIRSFVVRDGRLHLALLADGGIFELEPVGRVELHRP